MVHFKGKRKNIIALQENVYLYWQGYVSSVFRGLLVRMVGHKLLVVLFHKFCSAK